MCVALLFVRRGGCYKRQTKNAPDTIHNNHRKCKWNRHNQGDRILQSSAGAADWMDLGAVPHPMGEKQWSMGPIEI